MLDGSDEYFRIETKAVLSTDSDYGHRVKGRFKKAEDKGFFFIDKAGEEDNPHTVLFKNPTEENSGGLNPSALFEELFHAAQYVDNPNFRNNLQIETEAKVAKLFVFYNTFGEESINLENLKEFGVFYL